MGRMRSSAAMLLPSVQAPVSVTCFGCWRASVALATTVTALVVRARPLTGYPKGERPPDRSPNHRPVRFGEKLVGVLDVERTTTGRKIAARQAGSDAGSIVGGRCWKPMRNTCR